jgi:hypothetical protein
VYNAQVNEHFKAGFLAELGIGGFGGLDGMTPAELREIRLRAAKAKIKASMNLAGEAMGGSAAVLNQDNVKGLLTGKGYSKKEIFLPRMDSYPVAMHELGHAVAETGRHRLGRTMVRLHHAGEILRKASLPGLAVAGVATAVDPTNIVKFLIPPLIASALGAHRIPGETVASTWAIKEIAKKHGLMKALKAIPTLGYGLATYALMPGVGAGLAAALVRKSMM